MSIKIIKPQPKPPWELEISTEDGSTITLCGVQGEPGCQLALKEKALFGKDARVQFVNLTVKDLVDAAVQAQALSGRQVTPRQQ